MQRHANGRSVMEKASDLFANTRAFTKEHVAQANGFIHHKPILSMLLGAGVGLLAGLLFVRRVPKMELVVRAKGGAKGA